MFETIQAPDNVLALRFSGDLSADDMRQYSHQFERAIQDGGRQLGAVIDITGLSDLNPSALESGAQADLAFLQHIGQFHRMAFVSDKQWPIALVGLLKVALPVIETRVFASAQQPQAVDWAADATAVQQAAGGRPDVRGIQVIPSSDESVYAFEIDGTMSKEAVSRLVDDANAYFASHAQMKMLARIKHFGGVDLSALTQSGLLSMKFDAMEKNRQVRDRRRAGLDGDAGARRRSACFLDRNEDLCGRAGSRCVELARRKAADFLTPPMDGPTSGLPQGIPDPFGVQSPVFDASLNRAAYWRL